jgi:Flp pilus assembly protein protease CpaA
MSHTHVVFTPSDVKRIILSNKVVCTIMNVCEMQDMSHIHIVFTPNDVKTIILSNKVVCTIMSVF